MCSVARNVVQRAYAHWFENRPALLVHQDQRTTSGEGKVKLTARSFGVVMALGHEVFITDHAGLQESGSPKQATFIVLADRMESLNSIDDHVLSQTLPRPFVAVTTFHILDCAGYAQDCITTKLAGAKIHQHWYTQHWHWPPPHNWISIPTLGGKDHGSRQL